MRSRFLTVAGTAAAALACTAMATATAADTVELTKGHTEIVDIDYDAGAFGVDIRHDGVTPEVEYDPSQAVLRVPAEAAYTVPSGSCYTHLGTAGSTVYRLPHVENPNLLWPGLSGEQLTTGAFLGDKVQLKLTSLSGPGALTVYPNTLCPKNLRYFDSADSTITNIRNVTVGEHQHANWVFTKTGTYTAQFTVSGTLANGAPATPVTKTYTFKVGP